jgi:alanyl-tRNA synthetase
MALPPMITTAQLRSMFINFFVQRGHTHVESASLLPQGDPSLLFVNSGMVPFKDCFRGLESRPYVRATSCQKSLRVSGKHNDYDQIGQTPRHHTFFEMLGNFSLGDYFKEDAIAFAWDLITKDLKLPVSHLWVTVHHSDDVAAEIWQRTGVSAERIVRLGDDTNLWVMGDFGPRGYSSEIFYYMGDKPESQSAAEFMKDDGTYLEFWNLVFMQQNRNLDGTVIPLPKPCIDTGAGLERLASIIQGKKSNFDSDEIRSLISRVESLSGVAYDGSTYDRSKMGTQQWERDVAMRVIADHARSISFLIADGVAPSNEKEGYVLRRLIRRATLRGDVLGIHEPFLTHVTNDVIEKMHGVYPELKKQAALIQKLTSQEETQFRKTLAGGLKLLSEATTSLARGAVLPGDIAFRLHDTFGFPLDLTEDVLKDRGISVDRKRFDVLMEEQRERSRATPKGAGSANSAASLKELSFSFPATEFVGYDRLKDESAVVAFIPAPTKDGSTRGYLVLKATPFYAEMGGQVGDRGAVTINNFGFEVIDTQKTHSGHVVHVVTLPNGHPALESLVGQSAVAEVEASLRSLIAQNHSGTHLLGAALRNILGGHVEQRGSLVTSERFRFDFAHDKAVSPEQMIEVQTLINQIIRENHAVQTETLPLAKAKERGAVATFGEKYGESVRVVEMGPLSVELCGGTHVSRTGDIGAQVLLSEGSVASGVRRIEGVSGPRALAEIASMQQTLKTLIAKTKGTVAELPARIDALQQSNAGLAGDLEQSHKMIAELLSERLAAQARELNGTRFVVASVEQRVNRDTLMLVAERTLARLGKGAVALGQTEGGNVVVAMSGGVGDTNAGALVKEISQQIGGKGGGKPQLASLVSVPSDKFEHVYALARSRVGM